MSGVDTLIDRVHAKPRGAGKYQARCPAHRDRDPSLSIGVLPDGRVLIHCFAGCAPADVMAAVGMSLSDLYPERGLGEWSPLWWAQKERKERGDAERSLEHERLVLELLDGDRTQGKRLSRQELAREREAWRKVHGKTKR